MRIVESKPKVVKFSELNCGDAFYFNENFYMKINTVYIYECGECEQYDAVNLKTGHTVSVLKNICVAIKDIEITVLN